MTVDVCAALTRYLSCGDCVCSSIGNCVSCVMSGCLSLSDWVFKLW